MMAFIRAIALALALAAASGRNQYGAREDTLQAQPLNEATDLSPETRVAASADDSPSRKLKRSYNPWSTGVVYAEPYPSLNIWRPATYQISRPYFIPVYGNAGGIRIFYPPQPFYVNPGLPSVNKRPPFMASTYLPPVRPTTTEKPTSSMKIDDRFNGGDNDDDRPVWDKEYPQRPNQRPNTTPSTPTRRTRPPNVPQIPPLIHKPTDPEGFDDSNTLTTRPPPIRPTTTTTTGRPQTSEPSRCVWAIVSCCSSNDQISYECFEQRGCVGAFWDANPCDSDFARAAIAAALNYYNK